MATRTYDESQSSTSAPSSVFSRSVVLNWELIAYIVIFTVAVFTRFYMLGDRAMSHDESLHTVFSYDLFATGNYQHNPMMHGPILFHVTALSYALFGVDDASSRFYPAVLGILMVMFPILFRRWIGRTGAVLTATMILISPLLLYYHRYIRHDTPSILSGMLMFWAAMMYISGPQSVRRKPYWLYILAAAMIWNLGSKETAFIYVAIFGAFLTLYWAVRLYQHYFKADGKMAFYAITMAILTAGAVTMAMIVVISIALGQYPTLGERVDFVVNQTGALFSGGFVAVDYLTFLVWTGLTLVLTLAVIIGTGIWAYRAKPTHLTLLDGAVGLFAILLMILITQVFSHRTTINDIGEQVRVSTTAASLALGLIAALSVLMVYSATRIIIRRGFHRHLVYILAMIFVVFFGLILLEELSHESSRIVSSTSEVMAQPDPFALGDGSAAVATGSFKEYPLVIAWMLAAVVSGLIVYSKAKGWWRETRYFPEFDVLIIMGTLILPWLTAVFIQMSASESTDWLLIGERLAGLSDILPVNNVEQIGQFVIGLLAFLPMAIISVVVGLAWNWRRWLIAAVVFHALFAFFFTTVFSNIQGLASGMVYSLQYWMEQQGERRGSQPQYYYTNIIMPMYEYLPVIGSLLAMVAGWVFFWRKRAQRDDELALIAEVGAEVEIEDTPSTTQAETPADKDTEAVSRPLWPGILLTGAAIFGLMLTLMNALIRADAPASVFGAQVSGYVLAIFGLVIFIASVAALVMWYLPIASDHLQNVTDKDPFDPFEYVPQETGEYSRWRIDYVPFLLFVAWWAVFNLFGYTLAGEKMPWLGTHLTLPMIILTGWYFGRIIERIEWSKFANNGWIYLLILPLTLVAFFQLILPILGGQPPFGGSSSAQLRWTYNWIAAAVLFAGGVGGVYWLATKFTGWAHVRRMFALVVFGGLVVLTLRTSWMANYINYDLATEFLVYAHAGPANKFVVEQLRDISIRTTGGSDMRIMYDHKFSWPGSWYLRDFRDSGSAIFIGANVPTQQQLEGVAAVLVGSDMNPRVQPLLEDAFHQFQYVRMWWPMQDYFNLSAQDINNILDFEVNTENLKRRGLFDIWWSRDYGRYEQARRLETPAGFRQPSFSLTQWPVSDPLFVYVRRDIAAQVWQFGIGDSQVLNPFTEIRPNLCVENHIELFADTIFTDPANPLTRPMGLEIHDGQLFVANDIEAGARINIFTLDGEPAGTFGQPGGAAQEGAFFNRPNALTFAPDGSLFVVDTWNFRIRAFDADFEFITAWGQPQTDGFGASINPTDGFWGPRDVVLDAEGNVYISDTGNKRVRVYTPDGIYIYDIGRGGAGAGELNEPSGLAIHPDGRLFVADTWNQRIAVFDTRNGTFIENYDLRAWREGTGNRPYIALDVERDLMYVTDPDDRRVLVLDMDGECIGSFGTRSTEAIPNMAQFGDMGGIVVDDAGNIYVADSAFNRVLRFPPFPLESDEITEVLDDAVIEIEPEATAEIDGE